MSSPNPPSSSRTEATATLLAWGRRLWRRSAGEPGSASQPSPADALLEAGRRLRSAREQRGLGLRQLAQETRISITVLEALERGWRDRLPEPTYLRTMLSLLEQHLGLEPAALQAALPPRVVPMSRSGPEPTLRRFSLDSIELFSTWQGVVLYGVLCLALIYGLNRQQQQLAARGAFALQPIPADPARPDAASSLGERDRDRVLKAYPEVRPLERAGRGQALERLRQESKPAPAKPRGNSPGARTPAASSEPQQSTDVPPSPTPTTEQPAGMATPDSKGASPVTVAPAAAPPDQPTVP